jgi:phosphoribosylformylglycinamidine synthase II
MPNLDFPAGKPRRSSAMKEEPKVTLKTALDQGLTEKEFETACEILGRTPNFTELGVFALMWSEHCSYKSSRLHLKKFPTTGERVLQGPGENAGAIDIGNGLAAIFKVESHNHPSYVEPYQGAATGVGGILRDVFTMGARPAASMDSLRFGEASHPKTANLVKGVVAGIGGYGNCFGCPTVGGEVYFHPSYNGNILVNAFNLGICRKDKIFLAAASGVGNKVIYVGSRTGRDGIHGAGLLASKSFGEGSKEMRPTVQVGDPFQEKKLLEACLEAMEAGLVVGIQDMGAAGLSSSSLEMAGRAGTGIEMHLDRIPTREEGMTPYELMLSESQERMLIVAEAGKVEGLKKIFDKWDLNAVEVGEVTTDGRLKLYMNGELVGDLPAAPLSDKAPVYDRPQKRPAYLDELALLDLSAVPLPKDYNETLKKMVASPNRCSQHWVWNQYDSSIGSDTVFEPGHDAAMMQVKGTSTGIAISSDCNSRYCYHDPRLGGMIAVAESARNVACSGAKPAAFTNCLNFGNPEKPEIMWQFVEAIEGMAEAAKKLETPVISGNVSFYNESGDVSIFPTPTVVMVGLIDDVTKAVPMFFKKPGDRIILLGETFEELGASEYLSVIHKLEKGRPPVLDLGREKALQDLLIRLGADGLSLTAHDVSDGGIAVALCDCLFNEDLNLGATVKLNAEIRLDAFLFGETQSRAIVTAEPAKVSLLMNAAKELGVPARAIGEVTAKSFLSISVNNSGIIAADLKMLHNEWSNAFNKIVKEN